jgi:ubiquinone/menaquinone biosynthesis C-methylase UbiE
MSDYSPEMLAVPRRNLAGYSNVEFHLVNGASLPLMDGSADAVLANMYLHHAPIRRQPSSKWPAFKPGGRLVITDLDAHTHTWLQDEHDDIWLGFQRQQVFAWFQNSGLVNVRLEDTHQRCSSQSEDKSDSASIGISIAVGTKPKL